MQQRGKEPPCKTCKNKPEEVLSENRFIIYIVKYYGSMLVNQSGVSSYGVNYVLDLENIEKEERWLVVQKLLIFLNELIKIGKKNGARNQIQTRNRRK